MSFLPTTQCLQHNDSHIALKAHVNSELLAFKGHFPNCAVFPGVAQIAIVQQVIAEHFANLGTIQKIEQLRFQNFILPDQEIFIEVEQAEKMVNFKLKNAEQSPVASGRILFKH